MPVFHSILRSIQTLIIIRFILFIVFFFFCFFFCFLFVLVNYAMLVMHGLWEKRSQCLPYKQHAEQDQIDAKWIGKKVSFLTWESKLRQKLNCCKKSIKETENLIFFSVRANFISLMNTKTCIFTRGYRHSWKYCIWCSFGEIKFDLTQKKSNILYLFCYERDFMTSLSDVFFFFFFLIFISNNITTCIYIFIILI